MPDRPQKPELDNEQRYMALLALTTQELPAKQPGAFDDDNLDVNKMNASKLSEEQLQALYTQLDADPAALETLLRSERARSSAARAAAVHAAPLRRPSAPMGVMTRMAEFFAMPTVRYTAAFAAAGIAALAVVLQSMGPQPATIVRESYAELNIENADPRLAELVLPWERRSPALGFTGAANQSPAAFSFAAGLLKGKRKLLSLANNGTASIATTGADDSMEKYVLLGEWNIVVWTACEAKQIPPAQFWEKQISIGEALAKATYADPDEDATIKRHLASVHLLLVSLAHGETPARTARALANELLIFRERFAPNDQAARVQLEQSPVVAR